MAFKLQITCPANGINLNCRYENLSKYKKAEVVAKAPSGKVVKERTTYKGQVLGPGSTQRQWTDEAGTVYSKQELEFWYEDEQVSENAQTKVFTIEGYQPLTNYTDKYVIDKYYELFPDTNNMKKDYDKEIARKTNLFQMRKLWEELTYNKTVARGEFCPSSRGFIASDGYVRAILIDGNKWGLEVGVFKEEKVFQHLEEKIPDEHTIVQPAGRKRLKRV